MTFRNFRRIFYFSSPVYRLEDIERNHEVNTFFHKWTILQTKSTFNTQQHGPVCLLKPRLVTLPMSKSCQLDHQSELRPIPILFTIGTPVPTIPIQMFPDPSFISIRILPPSKRFNMVLKTFVNRVDVHTLYCFVL